MKSVRFALAVAIAGTAWAQIPSSQAYTALERFGKSQLTMEPNRGQAPAGIDFVAIGSNHKFLISPTGTTVELFDPRSKRSGNVHFEFAGANPSAAAKELDKVAFRSSYFTKRDPDNRQVGLPNFAKVRYAGTWPGVDVVYYGNRRKLEYDMIVAPGANPAAIRLKWDAPARFFLNKAGDLVIPTEVGTLTQHKPVAYQMIDNRRQEVQASYALTASNEVRIRLGKYDHARELVIDPTLSLSVGELNVAATSIAVDGAGNIYLAGQNNAGLTYIFKAAPDGSPIVLDQFIASTMGTVAITNAGVAYFTGATTSASFRTTTTAFQPNISESNGNKDAVFVQYVVGSNVLSYSTFFGGLGDDSGFAATFDAAGRGYITGQTAGGTGFTKTIGPAFGGGNSDGFVAVFNPNASGVSSLVYSTYIGGNGLDAGTGIQVDSLTNVFLGGVTTSTSASFHPTTATGYNTAKSTNTLDGFILRLDSTGVNANYLTFLPKAPIAGIALDSNRAVYATGDVDGTANNLATTASGYQLTNGGNGCITYGSATCTDAFLSKYDTNTNGVNSLLYSTYLGGNLIDSGYAVSVDANFNAYVVGFTNSSNFPVAQPLPGLGTYRGGAITDLNSLNSQADGFLAKINTLSAGAPSLIYSTYLGGTNFDQVTGVKALGCAAYVGGFTQSADFPTQPTQVPFNPPQGFLAKILDTVPALSIVKSHSANFTLNQQNATYSLTVANVGCGSTSGTVTVTDTVPSGLTFVSMTGTNWTCNSNSCNRSDVLAAGSSYPAITVTVNAGGSAGTVVNTASVSGGGAAPVTTTDSTNIVDPNLATLLVAKTHTGNFVQGQTNATYTVTVSNTSSTGSTSGTVTVTDNAPTGLTVTGMSGTGWNCVVPSCSRSSVLGPSTAYPTITVTVSVASNATSPLVNHVTVSGGGSPSFTASDSTIINNISTTLNVNRPQLNFGFNGSTITSPQPLTVSFTGGAGIAWTASANNSKISVTSGSGVGAGTFIVTANAPAVAGTYTITVTAPGAAGSPKQIPVNVVSVPSNPTITPFGSFDSPTNGTTGVTGAIAIVGWALDPIEVTDVGIWREPNSNESPSDPSGLMPIGPAGFVADARPDVQGAFPNSPFSFRAGWGYQLLTNFLPAVSGPSGNGTYKIHVIVTNATGKKVDLGAHTIVVDNAHAAKPFGTLDTPDQGGTASGNAFVNFGWVLAPLGSCIPSDGSTLTYQIDFVTLGHPNYNNPRSDISGAFPGYCNTSNGKGPVGYVILDTTAISNGVHTISWVAYDDQNRGDGIGSRYFTVLNSTGGSAAPEPPTQESIEGGVRARLGFDLHPRERNLSPTDGAYSVDLEQLGRLELVVGASRGFLMVGADETELPLGSLLRGGVFYWQPGAGFFGRYMFVFERPDGTRLHVRVNVVPKRYGAGPEEQ
jgi:uncharacterized repeat protein (TIGR01451 family)